MKKIAPWLIIAALITGWVLLSSQCNQKQEKENAQEIIQTLQDNPVVYHLNSDSQVVAKVDAIQATEANMKPLLKGNKKLVQRVGKTSRCSRSSILTTRLPVKWKDLLTIHPATRIPQLYYQCALSI